MAGILQEPWAKDGRLQVITRRTTSRDAFLDKDQEYTNSVRVGKGVFVDLSPEACRFQGIIVSLRTVHHISRRRVW